MVKWLEPLTWYRRCKVQIFDNTNWIKDLYFPIQGGEDESFASLFFFSSSIFRFCTFRVGLRRKGSPFSLFGHLALWSSTLRFHVKVYFFSSLLLCYLPFYSRGCQSLHHQQACYVWMALWRDSTSSFTDHLQGVGARTCSSSVF